VDAAANGARSPRFLLDAAILVAIVAIGAATFAGGLGFYSDDWAFLARMHLSPDQSFGGLYGALAVEPNLAVRPLQIALYAAYHLLAGDDPQVIHFANQAIFAAAIVWLYAGLRAIPALRSSAFAIAALYCCMPHFTTARLWYANAMAPLALLFFAIALHAIALADGAAGPRRVAMLATAGLALLACLLSYELFAFQLVAAPAFVSWIGGTPLRALHRNHRLRAATGVLVGCLVAAAIFKLAVGHGAIARHNPLAMVWLTVSSYAQAAWTDGWTLGVFLPRAVAGMLAGPWPVAAPLGAGAAVLALVAMPGTIRSRSSVDAARLAAAGAVAFVLGYLPLVVNFSWGFSPFGIDNRDNIAASLGLALVGVAAVEALARRFPLFARAVFALYCAIGVFVLALVGRTWDAGWTVQNALYERLVAGIGVPRARDTVVLYGACPYVGAAPVFTSSGELRDRLHYDTRVPGVDAVAVMNGAALTPGGLALTEYGYTQTFPYSAMTLFDARDGGVARIASYPEARAWFARHPLSESTGCKYRDGDGTPLY
jgi:hypothetical protein